MTRRGRRNRNGGEAAEARLVGGTGAGRYQLGTGNSQERDKEREREEGVEESRDEMN